LFDSHWLVIESALVTLIRQAYLSVKSDSSVMCVFSYTAISRFLLLWPSPWPDDLDMWTWHWYSEGVPAHQKCTLLW